MFLPPDMLAGIARERQATMLAEAESDRRARQARLAARQVRRGPQASPARGRTCRAGPSAGGILRDGSLVLIRPVQEGDAPLLADGFGQLSAESRWMRFLMAKQELSPSELRYFTSVDHHDHEALGALDHGDGRGVAIARYIRYPWR